jgi:hypothetical protein
MEESMNYLYLIYIDEKKADAMPKSEIDALMEETLAYNEALQKNGENNNG